MSCREDLCVLPPGPPAGCCDPVELPPPAPVTPDNPPGRAVLAYRIGTFTSFRRTMLTDLGASETGWKESDGQDYQTALVELWAYLADVLTFYQERIANEAFVGTATQRDSLRRLVALLGYQPRPAVGAVGAVALTIEKGKTVALPQGFRVGNRAAPGKIAAVFETDAGLNAMGDYSAIPLATRGPTRQFAPLSTYTHFYGGTVLEKLAAAQMIYGSLGSLYLTTFDAEQAIYQAAFGSATSGGPVISGGAQEFVSIGVIEKSYSYIRLLPVGNTREVVLAGTATQLKTGDHVLVIVNGGTVEEDRHVWRVNAVNVDRESGTTSIRWIEDAGVTYGSSDDAVELYALRVTASAFGHDAPVWALLPPEITNSDGKHANAPYKDNWDDSGNALHDLPSAGGGVLLDAVYEDAHGASDETTTRWAVLQDGGNQQVVKVSEAEAATVAAYSFNAKVTRLTLGETLTEKFGLRTTTILAGSERLAIEPNLPLGAVVAGQAIILNGPYPKLRDGQSVAIQGPEDGGDPDLPLMEMASLQGSPAVDEAHGITTITLKQPLVHSYVRAKTVLLANVVAITQGETVRDEILGSGDGSALQTLKLKQSPLTYLPASDPEGLATADSTLTVTVNRVKWAERPTLLGGLPDDQAFRTYEDDDEQTFVQFGDGVEGARPPTGRDNIHARYRKGAGANGNVETGGILRLIDTLPSVQKVINPVPTAGGADREAVDAIRVNAPASVATFGRAVSASDFAALALRYPGIGKASAAWVARDPLTHQPVPHPYILLTVATPDGGDISGDGGLLARLRAFLDGRRDPNVPLRIQDVTRVPVELVAEIDVDDRYGRTATLAAANAALAPETAPGAAPGFFSFDHLVFGQSIHLSELYAVIQGVAGVRAVRITTLRRLNPADPPGTIREHIFLRPFELASVANDPAHPENGRVALTLGTGGFDDA
jgi:uncharacterized phage protein gp47/JayE